MRKIQSKNPYTGELKASYDFVSNQQLQIKIQRASVAYQINRKKTFAERQAMIKKMGQIVESRAQQIAEAMTFEMGKPIVQSEGEVKKVIAFCNYYGGQFQEPEIRQLKTSNIKNGAVQKYLPTGIIYLIVPFNFPFFLHYKAGLPNLLLGNVILCRSADSCPWMARITEEIYMAAGFCNGQYQDVFTSYNQLDLILQSPSVSGVSFTGSSRSGAVIAEASGKHLKKAVMELGGNDPFVLLEDGDLNLAISQAIKYRCINAGQVCTAPKRFIIVKEHYQQFKEGLIEGLKKVKHGDPMSKQTQIGPLARQDLHENLQKQLKELPASYKIIYQRQDMKKPFFPITVIECAKEEWDEELFGPVYLLYRVDNYQQALQIANFGTYGLGSSVFSAKRGEEFANEVRCGIVAINSCPVSSYEFPIGGVERSGFGRECQKEGYMQFANLKTFLFH